MDGLPKINDLFGFAPGVLKLHEIIDEGDGNFTILMFYTPPMTLLSQEWEVER